MTKVYVRGWAFVPSRFWDYALATDPKYDEIYADLDFRYSEEDTKEYLEADEETKKKIKFTYINGEKQYN